MADLNLSPDDIKAVFGMPPKDAVAFFERKGLKISWDWQEVWRHANAVSFTVAKATRLDVLTDIYTAIQDDLKHGGTFAEFKNNLQPILEAKGWWGKQEQINRRTGEIREVTYGTPHRLATIYETNTQVAYMAGRYEQMKAAVMYSPWWEYAAVMDNRTRPQHAALNGLVFRHDDPFWATWYPPNGFRCRCRVIPRTDMARKRGEFVTSSGEGRMETVTQSVKKRDGSIAKVAVTGYKDPITKKVITPDLGWDYNPAAEANRARGLLEDKQKAAPGPLSAASKKHD